MAAVAILPSTSGPGCSISLVLSVLPSAAASLLTVVVLVAAARNLEAAHSTLFEPPPGLGTPPTRGSNVQGRRRVWEFTRDAHGPSGGSLHTLFAPQNKRENMRSALKMQSRERPLRSA